MKTPTVAEIVPQRQFTRLWQVLIPPVCGYRTQYSEDLGVAGPWGHNKGFKEDAPFFMLSCSFILICNLFETLPYPLCKHAIFSKKGVVLESDVNDLQFVKYLNCLCWFLGAKTNDNQTSSDISSSFSSWCCTIQRLCLVQKDGSKFCCD